MKNLIFLISRPHLESTLTQRLPASHKEVYTSKEAWLRLSSAFASRKLGIQADYEHLLSQYALQGD